MRNKLMSVFAAGMISLLGLTTAIWAQESVNEDIAGPNRVFGGIDWFSSHNKNSTDSVSITQSIWAGMIGYEYGERETLYFLTRALWGGGNGDTDKWGENYNLYSHPWFVEGRIGYQFGLGDFHEFGVTPYIGYLYQSQRGGYKNNSAMIGYSVKPRSQNIDLGVLFDWKLTPEFSVGLNCEALISVWGRVTLNGQSNGTLFTSQTLNLRSRVNWLFELPLTYQFLREWDLTCTPFYSWHDYKARGGVAFKQIISNTGLRLALGYRF